MEYILDKEEDHTSNEYTAIRNAHPNVDIIERTAHIFTAYSKEYNPTLDGEEIDKTKFVVEINKVKFLDSSSRSKLYDNLVYVLTSIET